MICAYPLLRRLAAHCTDGPGTRRADTHAAAIDVALEFFGATLQAAGAPPAAR